MTNVFPETSIHKHSASFNFSDMLHRIQKIFGEYLERRELKVILASLSESELRDIGLTDADVLSLEYLRMEESSAHNIAKAQKTRNGKW